MTGRRLGSLFSGIGGFELAWQRNGGTVAWMCEIDRNARKVLAERFPGVPIYEDVEQVDPAEVEAVDVLSGGSPCQGFSMAGTRSGLEHGESRLFADYIRIVEGLAGRGLRWAVWENVPGVLSIKDEAGERTFEHVIGALAGADAPVRLDPRRKWNAGVVAGAGRSVAWRVVDSRHFGVPQRRRRVYAAVAFGDPDGGRAGRAVLAVPEGVRRDPPACVTKGQDAAGGVAGRFGVAGGDTHTLTKAASKGATEDGTGRGTPIVPQSFNWMQGDGETALQDHAQTVLADSRPGVLVPQVFRKSARARSTEDAETWVNDGDANTLNVFDVGDTRSTHAVVKPVAFDKMNFTISDDHQVLRAGTRQSTGVVEPLPMSARVNTSLDEPPTLMAQSSPNRGGSSGPIQMTSYGVRRLTPVECERLQAFPDGWTEPAGSDSARYKALGNAITVNVAAWLFSRILEVDDDALR